MASPPPEDVRVSKEHIEDSMELGSDDSSKRNSISSDEGGVRPVRKELAETSMNQSANGKDHTDSIAHDNAATSDAEVEKHGKDATDIKNQGRLRRKRSIEDVDERLEDVKSKPGRHGRKRSRDGDEDSADGKPAGQDDIGPNAIGGVNASLTSTVEQNINGLNDQRAHTPEADDASMHSPTNLTSPKGKRNRAQFLQDNEYPSPQSMTAPKNIPATETNETVLEDPKLTGEGERSPKRQRSGSPKPASLRNASENPLEKIPSLAGEDGTEKSIEQGSEQTAEDASKKSTTKSSEAAKDDTAKLPASSAFGNLSATSPFAALSGKKSPSPLLETSKSAFEASAFSKLAQSSTSGFGALGASSGSASPFGGVKADSKFPPVATSKTIDSVFGGGLGSGVSSGFGSLKAGGASTGFGGLSASGSPFGSAFSSKPGLSSFSGNGKPPIHGISGKAAKPFGAPTDVDDDEEDDEDSGDDDAEATSTTYQDELNKKDKRFHEQDVETGEEGERTLFIGAAKLYYFAKENGWKERGAGSLKLNVTHSGYDGDSENSDSDSASIPRRARLLMRAKGSHRVVLNSAVLKQTPLGGDVKGSKPEGGNILFWGQLEDIETPVMMQLKMSPENAEKLWIAATELKSTL